MVSPRLRRQLAQLTTTTTTTVPATAVETSRRIPRFGRATAAALYRRLPLSTTTTTATTGSPGPTQSPPNVAPTVLLATGGGDAAIGADSFAHAGIPGQTGPARGANGGPNITTTENPMEDDQPKLILYIVLPVCLAVIAFVLLAVAVRCIRRRKAANQARNETPDLWIRNSQELPLYAVDCTLPNPHTEIPLSPKTASLIEASDDEGEDEEAIPPERLKPRVSSFMIKKRVLKPEGNGQIPNDEELRRLSRSHSEFGDIISLPRSRASTAGSLIYDDPDYVRFQQRSPACRLSIPDRFRNGSIDLRLGPPLLSNSDIPYAAQRRMNPRRSEPLSLLLQAPPAARTNPPRPTRPAPPPPPSRKSAVITSAMAASIMTSTPTESTAGGSSITSPLTVSAPQSPLTTMPAVAHAVVAVPAVVAAPAVVVVPEVTTVSAVAAAPAVTAAPAMAATPVLASAVTPVPAVTPLISPVVPPAVVTSPTVPVTVTAPVVVAPVVTAPVVATPVVTAPVMAAPVVTAPVVTAPVVTAPVVAAPIVTAPVVTAPVVTAPVVTAPVVAAPVVTAPVVTAPVVTAPLVTTPVVAAPVEAAPVVISPAETPSTPAPLQAPVTKNSTVPAQLQVSNPVPATLSMSTPVPLQIPVTTQKLTPIQYQQAEKTNTPDLIPTATPDLRLATSPPSAQEQTTPTGSVKTPTTVKPSEAISIPSQDKSLDPVPSETPVSTKSPTSVQSPVSVQAPAEVQPVSQAQVLLRNPLYRVPEAQNPDEKPATGLKQKTPPPIQPKPVPPAVQPKPVKHKSLLQLLTQTHLQSLPQSQQPAKFAKQNDPELQKTQHV